MPSDNNNLHFYQPFIHFPELKEIKKSINIFINSSDNANIILEKYEEVSRIKAILFNLNKLNNAGDSKYHITFIRKNINDLAKNCREITDYKSESDLNNFLKEKINAEKMKNELIKKDTIRYLMKKYEVNESEIKCNKRDKSSGKQLGLNIIMTHNGKKRKFFVKTQRYGHIASNKTDNRENLDIKEIFLYRVLCELGLSPKPDFFGSNPKDIYIITENAGYDKKTKTERKFSTYNNLIRNKLTEKEKSSLIDGFYLTEIVTRIFRLSDLIGNPTNIGLSESNIFKIIDFSVEVEGTYISENIEANWLSGNAGYNYSSSLMIDTLKTYGDEKKQKDKIKNCKILMKNFDKLEEAIIIAKLNILRFIKTINFDKNILDQQIRDLNLYERDIKTNYNSLSEYIKNNGNNQQKRKHNDSIIDENQIIIEKFQKIKLNPEDKFNPKNKEKLIEKEQNNKSQKHPGYPAKD